MRKNHLFILLSFSLLVATCEKSAFEDMADDVADDEIGLSATQKLRAEQLISLFENGTIDIQYDYAEDLTDGRGITCGRAGFTTATGDALEVVELYSELNASNALAVYLPTLRTLAAAESDDTSELGGFEEAWVSAADDTVFQDVQDEVVDELYYQPSQELADEIGLETALGRAELYDTIIQHGEGDDPDGLPALLEAALASVGGTPATGVDEEEWISAFLVIRRNDLLDPYNTDTQAVWAESVGRVDVFSALLADGNLDLDGPIVIDTADYSATIP